MSRTIIARRELFGEPKRFIDVLTTRTRELLQQASDDAQSNPDGDGSFTITLRSQAVGVPVHKEVRVRLGEAHEHGPWLRVPLTWEATGAKGLFPTFDGGIELEQHDRARCGLTLAGVYRPPLGPVGSLADTLGLEGQAQEASGRLLDRLARAVVTLAGEDGRSEQAVDTGQLLVGQIATRHPLTVPASMSLRAAAHLLLLARVSGLPVQDEDGALVGVLSEADLLDKVGVTTGFGPRAAAAARRHAAITVGEACSRPALTTDVASPVRAAATEMAKQRVDRLVVMDGATVVGILTRHDVLKVLVRPDEEVQDAVEAVIARVDEPGVTANISDGILQLTGTASTRSKVGELLQELDEIDGLLDVDGTGLRWEIDDVPPPIMG